MTRPTSARDIVRSAQAGDADAFGELVARYHTRLEALVTARMSPALRRRTAPEDVVQETLTRALQAIHRFRWEGEESFLWWLVGIARNVISHAARDDRMRPGSEALAGVVGDDVTASRAARREERFDRLRAALRRLTCDQREVLRLSRIEGLKIREIAERTGKSVDAVKQLLLRGLRSLRQNFGDTESLRLPDRLLFSEDARDEEGGSEE